MAKHPKRTPNTRQNNAPAMKTLLTVLTVSTTIGGWALFATADTSNTSNTSNQASEVTISSGQINGQVSGTEGIDFLAEPIPTLVSRPTQMSNSSNSNVVPVIAQPQVVEVSQPQPVLRQVSAPAAPAPVTSTRSSG
jgi:hypothetical protein